MVSNLQDTDFSRAHTNASVIQNLKASLEINKNPRNGNRQINLFSELVLEKRGRLACHILTTRVQLANYKVSTQNQNYDS